MWRTTKTTNSSPEKTIDCSNLNTGRWEADEKVRFIKSCLIHGNDWKKAKQFVKTRTLGQIRSHAQKFINQICKNQEIRNKEFMDNVRKLDFKSKNCSNMFGDDSKLLEKHEFNYHEMDEIEKRIIIKFKLNCSKEYDCLNEKIDPEGIVKRGGIRSKIAKSSNDSATIVNNDAENKKVLFKKIASQYEKLLNMISEYNSLGAKSTSSSCEKLNLSQIQNDQQLLTDTKDVSIRTNTHATHPNNQNELSGLGLLDFNDINECDNNIFSLFDNQNVSQFLMDKREKNNEEDNSM